MSGRNMTVLLLLAVTALILSNTLYVIKQTERGVLLRFGEVVNPDLQPGLHWKIPFVNNVRKFDGRILSVDSQPERFFTQEQKALIVDSYAKFRIAVGVGLDHGDLAIGRGPDALGQLLALGAVFPRLFLTLGVHPLVHRVGHVGRQVDFFHPHVHHLDAQ